MSYTGDMIRKYRKEKGLTQKKLGELCGIADSNIRKYESGAQNPKLETLDKIANAFNIDVWALYENYGLPDPLESSQNTSAFLNYLEKLGYEFIDGSFYDADAEEVGLLHIKSDNADIPLTRNDFDNLEKAIKDNIELEIYRLRREKHI
ncbi:transcriptional repressor DicA [uncultured Roseburia sp.]|uniref:Helix-turn-helix domain-containing protein n=1 Tax=Brotonthovivens ammoniilytica TaxID=2981725 RepID=A0ABT2TIY6_9FIRM|nr:helix-turn-helix transcriptional regulator [Brotonthovivens ammoniilytica]MCU6762173.1 helix-turn-helix domain-containing protein [Brotonthovivens ammoniilytica]SCI57793.1 transcriptional repressor DicA [uncultured Roseburia sp.]